MAKDDLQLVKDVKKTADKVFGRLPKILRWIILIIVIIGVILYGFNKFFVEPIKSWKDFVGDKNTPEESKKVEPPNIIEKEVIQNANIKGCSTSNDWVPFTDEYWSGLRKGFVNVNGVFSLPDIRKKVDSIARYKYMCPGGFMAEVQFIPVSGEFINLNLVYDNWFRWEIGGNDMRSVKLYKNLQGCKQAALKDVRLIETDKKYFTTSKKIKTGSLVTATMSALLTPDAKLRTEVELEFTDDKSGHQVKESGFFWEFDVGENCSSINDVIDPTIDSQSIGINLQYSDMFPNTLSKIRLVKFRLSPFNNPIERR